MLLKIFFTFIILFNLGIPSNTLIDLIFILAGITLLFFSMRITYFQIYKNFFFYCIIILSIINLFIPKYLFNEAHSVFLTKNDISIINNFLPKNISEEIEKSFFNSFDFERLENASGWNKDVHKKEFLKNEFAFSSDNFFHNSNLTRFNSKINFDSRENLRIGQINSLTFNWPWDTPLRRILPYYVYFEVPKFFGNSEICYKGNLYYSISDNQLISSEIKNQKFIKLKDKNCFKVSEKNKVLHLIGYSINDKDNLQIKLKNNYLLILNVLKYFLVFIIIFCILKIYKFRFKTDSYIYLISIITSLILAFVRDGNTLLGLRYFRGGADGLLHYSWGREILQNLANNNYLEALRGNEDIFYFMPGLRYFGSINNILFGETIFGYFIVCTFIPFIFYKIFELLYSKKIGIYFTILFIFFPIFENMGIGHFNFIWNFARFHAEPLSIFLFLISLFLVIKINTNFNNRENNYIYYFVGILFALSIFLRPNYFPASVILFAYFSLLTLKTRNFKIFFINLIGYSFVFICLIHNLYFGNEAYLFTKSIVNFKLTVIDFFDALFSILIIDFNNENLQTLISQLKIWNPLYNLHRLLMILYILFMFIKIKQPSLNYVLLICIACQHGLLILTHPGGRYAYFAWILTFLLFAMVLLKPKKLI